MKTLDSLSVSPLAFVQDPSLVRGVPRASLRAKDGIETSKARASSATLSDRPALTPVDQCLSEFALIDAIQGMRNVSDSVLNSTVERLGRVRETMEKISAEYVDKLSEAAARASTSNVWGVLKKIATALVASLSVVFGLSYLGAGGSAIVAGALVFSGISSVTNFAMTELGVWDKVAEQLAQENKEKQKMLAILLPTAVGLLSGVVGAAGSVYAIASGATEFVDKAVLLAQCTLAVFSGVTSFGKGVADARTTWSKADLSFLESKLTIERFEMGSLMKQIEGLVFGTLKAAKSTSDQILRLISEANIRVVQQSSV